jgi:hypothetical protein
MYAGTPFSNPKTFSVSSNCWLNEYKRSSSLRRCFDCRASRLARSDNSLAMIAVAKNAKSATQFCGSAIVNLNSGGRKK